MNTMRQLNRNYTYLCATNVQNVRNFTAQKMAATQKAVEAQKTSEIPKEKETEPMEGYCANYCINLVKKNDHENYLCTLLMQGAQRRHAFALRAFNVEVAQCNTAVSEEHIGKMRLQFWYDSVEKCFQDEKSYVEKHPVLRELKYAVGSNQLNKVYLKRLVKSRDRGANEQFATVQDLEDYAHNSYASLYYLLVQLCNVKDIQVDHAVSHLGKAQGIATLLRSIPYLGRTQPLNIPMEILIRHGVSQERFLRAELDDKGVEDCIYEVASVAHQHLEKASNLCAKVPKELRSIFLPAVPVRRYLERLRKAQFRLTDPKCMQRDAMLPLSLYWHKIRGKF